MSSVYSTHFISAVGLVGTRAFTVPAGFVAVLRDLDVYNGGGFSATQVYLHGGLGQTIWFNNFAGPGAAYASWRGRQVLTAGFAFDITTNGACDATLSGYLLSAP